MDSDESDVFTPELEKPGKQSEATSSAESDSTSNHPRGIPEGARACGKQEGNTDVEKPESTVDTNGAISSQHVSKGSCNNIQPTDAPSIAPSTIIM